MSHTPFSAKTLRAVALYTVMAALLLGGLAVGWAAVWATDEPTATGRGEQVPSPLLSLPGVDASAGLPPGVTAEWWAATQTRARQNVGLSPTPDWTAAGENDGDGYGISVATAGDVNGDGYADVAVGASGYPGGADRGQVYVYYGSPTGLSLAPDWTATGENALDLHGTSVAAAGDVNGDGYADIAVGAAGHGNERGKAYLYYGSPTGLSLAPDWTATGEAEGDAFGTSVATAGDVNGDGFADVVVGALGYPAGANQGKAYLYYGSVAGLSPVADWSASGEHGGDSFGVSATTAGDVNGDGYADLVVGAHGYPNGVSRGKAYAYHGSAAGLSLTPVWTITGENDDDGLGLFVSAAGDANGDGYADVTVGAVGYGSDRGKAYVYYGTRTGLNLTPDWTAVGENGGDRFGAGLATAGDVDGDGYADLLVGAYGYPSGAYRGKAYLYHGATAGPSASPDWTASGENDGDRFGRSVATAGDVNGDGYADVIDGAVGYGSDRGKAYVYHGMGGGLAAAPAFVASGENGGEGFGYAVASAGDVNGDGYGDLVAGAYGYLAGDEQGRAYVYHGGPGGLSSVPVLTLTGEIGARSDFGVAAAGVGDVNGDGYGDVAVGAHHYNINTGRAYIYHGGPNGLSSSPATILDGESILNYFGMEVGTAGDVNGDGYSDVLVGAYAYGSYRGGAFVYHGGPEGVPITPTRVILGSDYYAYMGWALGAAGDVNGDGYGDIILGEPGGADSDTGRVYVYHGGPEGLALAPALTFTGEAIFDFYGYAVGTAGDVNADGYADVLISAPSHDDSRGRVYIHHGGPGGISATPALTFTGEITGISFGISVGTAGDVNGDGYSDVLVGASGAYSSTGRVYLYFGGPGGLSPTPALFLDGEDIYSSFGRRVRAAGDADGDGYAEVAIGAPAYNAGAGRAYVYHGTEGGGRLVLARQGRGDGSGTPVQPWGLSLSGDGFQLRMMATDPMGRGQVKLQVEACPPGEPFAAPACLIYVAPAWTDVTTATSGVTLTEVIGGLAPDTLYRWRARLLYAPQHVTGAGVTPPPNPAHGPWRRLQAQALEADLRTSAVPVLSLDKTAGDTMPDPGQLVTYTLVISNQSPFTATQGVVSDSLASGLTFAGPVTVEPPGAGIPGAGPPILVTGLAVDAGGQVTVTYPVSVNTGIAGGTVIHNTAAVTCDQAPQRRIGVAEVTVQNVAPLAAADAYTTTTTMPLVVAPPGVLGNDWDLNDDLLAAALEDDPESGTLALAADGSFVYTPTLGEAGVVTFSYRADDGAEMSNTATVTISVHRVGYQVYLPLVVREQHTVIRIGR
jgi:uncharacterized repeat protein (TIGR01451 family)